MGIDPVTLAIGSLVVSSAFAYKGQQQQKAAFEAQKRQAEAENVRNIRKAIARQRVAQGSILNQGALGGALGSSAVAGGIGATQSQLAGDVNFANTTLANQTASGMAQVRASESAALGQVAGTVFNQMGGFKTIFDAVKKTNG
jgi:phosphoribosylformylglycinamidine (FGAM) synthase-like enzyme